jgi:hypothetical protein
MTRQTAEGHLSSLPAEVTVSPMASGTMWWYGLALVIGHFLCFGQFATDGRVQILLRETEPICWPFFENCQAFRFSSLFSAALLLGGYFGVTVLSGALWALKRGSAFRICMWVALVVLVGLVCSDYRYRQNQFYMFVIANVVYLISKSDSRPVRLVIVLFYFWAGILKLNREWLSGAVLYNDIWGIPHSFNPILCAYVVVLELVIAFGLLSGSRRVFWFAGIQFAAFHLVSLTQITWFYPALMAALLSIFWIDHFATDERGRRPLVELFRGKWPGLAYGAAGAFSLLQLIPYCYRGDRVLTGQGRIFALHMFEARQDCVVTATFRYEDGHSREKSLLRSKYPPRMVCDPIVYYNAARNACRGGLDGALTLDLVMRSKRRTDLDYTTIIDVVDFCGRVDDYVVAGNNWWMKG